MHPISVTKLAQLGYFTVALLVAFGAARAFNQWLNHCAKKEPRQWFYPAYPLIGRLLYYNLIWLSLYSAVRIVELPNGLRGVANSALSILGVVVNIASLIQLTNAIEDMAIAHINPSNSFKMRRTQTRVRIFKQLSVFVLSVVGIGCVLMNFEPVRKIGAGLLASAGVAGVIVGLAAQKSLSTIIAGLQIAITQPLKIGDIVIVESEYGEIEEITLTYVVVRTWDQRRLIIPITQLLEKGFQNWTRNSTELLGTVFIYTDFLVPIEKLRQAAQQIVAESELWDRRVFAFQVTDWKSSTTEIRILVSAVTASKLFDLRCEVREKMLSYVQTTTPDSFPRMRSLNPS